MGSRWNERPAEDDALGADQADAAPSNTGLAAAELDLLRRAPDYDAEEMATVRPSGGWSTVVPPAETPPLRPSWLPPNRIEPPPRASAPVETATRPRGELTPAVASPAALWFPEERTMALMAEDLLGRALDEPAAPAGAAVAFERTPPASVGAESSGAGADIWDAAMPLQAEG